MEGLSYGGDSYLNYRGDLEIDEEDFIGAESDVEEGDDAFFGTLGDRIKQMQSNIQDRRTRKLDLKSKQMDVDTARLKAETEQAKAEASSMGKFAESMKPNSDNQTYWIIGGIVLVLAIGIGVYLYIKSKKG